MSNETENDNVISLDEAREAHKAQETLSNKEIALELVQFNHLSFEYDGAKAISYTDNEHIEGYRILPLGMDWSESGRRFGYFVEVYDITGKIPKSIAAYEVGSAVTVTEDIGHYARIDLEHEGKGKPRISVTSESEEAKYVNGILRGLVESEQYALKQESIAEEIEKRELKKQNRLPRRVLRALGLAARV